MRLIYYIFINIAAFIAFGLDKRSAKLHRFRISEMFLLSLILLGGFLGGFFGMKVFRHKTKKPKFKLAILASLLIHVRFILQLFKQF